MKESKLRSALTAVIDLIWAGLLWLLCSLPIVTLGAASAALGLLCACTLLVALGLSFSNYRDFISQYAPGKYLALYRLFTLR